MAKVRSIFLRFLVFSALGFGVLALVGFFLIPRIVQTEKVKPQLERAFSDFLTRPITIEALEWEWFPAPILIGKNVQLTNKDGFVMSQSPIVEIGLSFRGLLKKKVIIEDLVFVEPKGTLRRTKDGRLPLVEMIQDIRASRRQKKGDPKGKPLPFKFETISIQSGQFVVLDQTIKSEPLSFSLLVDASGDIVTKEGSRTFPFELQAKVNQSRGQGDLRISGDLQKYSDVRVVAQNWPVTIFKEHVRFLRQWQGRTSFTSQIQASASGVRWRVNGKSKDLKPMTTDAFPNLGVTYGVYSYRESTLRLEAKSDSSDVRVDVRVPEQNNLIFISSVTSSKLDVEEFVNWTKIVGKTLEQPAPSVLSTTQTKKGMMKRVSWALRSSFDLKDVRYRSILLDALTLNVTRDSTGTVTMAPLVARSGDGLIEAKATFFGGMSAVMSHLPRDYRVDWNMTNINLAPLVDSFIGEQRASGLGQTNGYIVGNIDDRDWRRTGGRIYVALRDGEVWGVPGLLQAFSRLNVTSLLKETRVNSKKGFPFNVARATVTLSRGKVRVDPPGVFENKTLRIGVMGNVDLRSKQVDGKLVFYFLTVVGEVLKAVPGVETILYNNRKSFAPIWVGVKGSVDSPRIRVLPIRSVTNTLWQTIESVFKFPFRRRMKK